MPESGKDPKEHFIIQRRNLFLCSLISIFYASGEIQFTKINFFEIKSEHLIISFLLISLIYLLIRFLQTLKEMRIFFHFVEDFYCYKNEALSHKGFLVETKLRGMKIPDYPPPKGKIRYVASFVNTPKRKFYLATQKANKRTVLKGIKYFIVLAEVNLWTLQSFITFSLTRRQALEHFFPIILAFGAILEIFNYNWFSCLIAIVSGVIEMFY